MKNGIIFLVVTALVILILVFTYKIVKNINAQKEVDELYASHKRNKVFILRVLDAAFWKKQGDQSGADPREDKRRICRACRIRRTDGNPGRYHCDQHYRSIGQAG